MPSELLLQHMELKTELNLATLYQNNLTQLILTTQVNGKRKINSCSLFCVRQLKEILWGR